MGTSLSRIWGSEDWRDIPDDWKDDAEDWIDDAEDLSDIPKATTPEETFEKLKADPKFSEFFSFTFPDLKVGRKIANGRQREVYEGDFTLMSKKFPCAVKIFSEGFSLHHIRRQFPEGMLKGGSSVFPGFSSGTSSILGGLVLEDGEFAGRHAIVMRREWGDLRTFMTLRVRKRKFLKQPPFKDGRAKRTMLEIATGMRQLHSHGILHRNLRSTNVLVCSSTTPSLLTEDIEDNSFHCKVFGFESSVGVKGTTFWMAPEILLDIHEGSNDGTSITKKSDVYSYAIVCYEILTGRVPPREGFTTAYKDRVLRGHRPKLPKNVDGWLRKLIESCWLPDPSRRPEFDEIVEVLKSKLPDHRTPTRKRDIKAASKYHWSDIPTTDVDVHQKKSNHQVFESLKEHPEYSKFFSYTFRNLKVGPKLDEGGQAEIFEAEFEKENGVKVPCVVKLFKHMRLGDMVKQWPSGMLSIGESPGHLRFGFMGLYSGATRTCEVLGAMVDENGDFGFVFNREGGDLWKLIERRMNLPRKPSTPFQPEFAKKVMLEIALGMQHLHDHGILHRDLKAVNVLVTNVFGEFPGDKDEELMDIKVADFESSMLTKGTKFWRAPEILKHLPAPTFTREADVYSYGMTCYEVLTGKMPLKHLRDNDYAAVFEKGARPKLPAGVDDWLRVLIERCWSSEPSSRPQFKEIVEEFGKHSF